MKDNYGNRYFRSGNSEYVTSLTKEGYKSSLEIATEATLFTIGGLMLGLLSSIPVGMVSFLIADTEDVANELFYTASICTTFGGAGIGGLVSLVKNIRGNINYSSKRKKSKKNF